VDVSARPVGCWSESLALQALLHITLSIVEYLGLVVPLVNCGRGIVLPHGSHSCHHEFLASLFKLHWSETSQIQVKVELGVGYT